MKQSVRFEPAGLEEPVYPGDTLLDVALAARIALEHECGGNCACTTCHVIISGGAEYLTPPEQVELDRLEEAEARCSQSRLACQAIIRLTAEEFTISAFIAGETAATAQKEC